MKKSIHYYHKDNEVFNGDEITVVVNVPSTEKFIRNSKKSVTYIVSKESMPLLLKEGIVKKKVTFDTSTEWEFYVCLYMQRFNTDTIEAAESAARAITASPTILLHIVLEELSYVMGRGEKFKEGDTVYYIDVYSRKIVQAKYHNTTPYNNHVFKTMDEVKFAMDVITPVYNSMDAE